MFYGMIGYSLKKLSDSYYSLNDTNNTSILKEYSSDVIKSINVKHNDEYKQTLLYNLLSLNSLDRCYILHFIFKRKGNFTSSTLTETETENVPKTTTETVNEKEYNSYELYNKIIEKYKLTSLDFNLDETEEPDIVVNIGELKYELTIAKLHFIQWVYYTGLYDYLMSRDDIKYEILTEMNEQSLFSGNLFLRYQLFLCKYEQEQEQEQDNSVNPARKLSKTDSDDSDDTDDADDADSYNEQNLEKSDSVESLNSLESLDLDIIKSEKSKESESSESSESSEASESSKSRESRESNESDESDSDLSENNYDEENEKELLKCKYMLDNGINNNIFQEEFINEIYNIKKYIINSLL